MIMGGGGQLEHKEFSITLNNEFIVFGARLPFDYFVDSLQSGTATFIPPPGARGVVAWS